MLKEGGGENYLEMLNVLYNISDVKIFDIKDVVMDKYADEMGDKYDFNIVKCADSEFAVMGREKGCGTKLEISENDLELLYWEGTFFAHYYAAFKCPICGKMNSTNGSREETFERLKKKGNAKFDGNSDSI